MDSKLQSLIEKKVKDYLDDSMSYDITDDILSSTELHTYIKAEVSKQLKIVKGK